MVQIGGLLFFHDEKDFLDACHNDLYGRGLLVKVGYNNYPIKHPDSFPAAFEYVPDYVPTCIGNYNEVSIDSALREAAALLCKRRRELDDLYNELSKLGWSGEV